MTDDTLTGKVVLVTGGGAGLGRSICVDLAQHGAAVVIAAPGANGAETAQLVGSFGLARHVTADVTIAADLQRAVDTAVEDFGRLDGIVHNATSRHSSGVEAIDDITDEVWDDHVAVSLRGAYHCARAGFAALRESGGRFVLMTSPAGIEGSAGRPAYSAVKGAVRGLVKSLALEWGPHGVTVVGVSPLAMTPAMADAYVADPQLERRLSELVPLGRVGDSATDVAPVVRFLLEDGSRYISGQTIVVDGGRFTTL
ncbi:MAG TPA: SDR family NAD(P)-dependent oxidoreductase [Mycobacteriales bacterium]|jgi:3-oxoacyl-[acyl-carrier protein] reductase|nr:SDR family NAD(P)-dependent oxidoreductase [Mycobacteriales bacterium]